MTKDMFYSKVPYVALIIMLICALPLQAVEEKNKDDNQEEEVVELSGISIIGNRELPKTLFIVPWKNTEVGYETRLTNTLDEGMKPVDKEVFMRELDYYDFLHAEGFK